jgi:hypothetical protein
MKTCIDKIFEQIELLRPTHIEIQDQSLNK